jgi:hypothetical protein
VIPPVRAGVPVISSSMPARSDHRNPKRGADVHCNVAVANRRATAAQILAVVALPPYLPGRGDGPARAGPRTPRALAGLLIRLEAIQLVLRRRDEQKKRSEEAHEIRREYALGASRLLGRTATLAIRAAMPSDSDCISFACSPLTWSAACCNSCVYLDMFAQRPRDWRLKGAVRRRSSGFSCPPSTPIGMVLQRRVRLFERNRGSQKLKIVP